MDACAIWLESFKSQSTKKSYKIHLLMFCKYHNTDPDSLVQLKADQIKNMVIDYIVQLKKVAKQYVSKAKRGEICVNSIKTYVMGIQSFLEFHEIALPGKKISRFYPPEIANNLRAYTKEEIIKILSVADLRDRCIILLMISTGIRVGAIKSLKLKHLKKLKEEIGILTVYAESKNDRYNALITPECIAAIDDYLQYRKKQCEKITDDSYIIRDKFATFSKKTNRAKPLSENTINKQMRKAGLSYEELQPDHSLRRFFNTALMNSDVTYSFKELMMGHSVKLDNVYYDKDNEKSREKILLEYMKAIDALTINDEYRLKKKIVEYEEKLKHVPKIEQLESHLANKILEQEAIKKQLEKLRNDKDKENQMIEQKYEQAMKAMRQEMENKLQQILAKIDVANLK
ncbi:MAG TPA: site-specific integrase [Candidatus Eisenbacteria bacterium]|nr:site-specific integrase [Candidatus Eisenbacteria bacterium]